MIYERQRRALLNNMYTSPVCSPESTCICIGKTFCLLDGADPNVEAIAKLLLKRRM